VIWLEAFGGFLLFLANFLVIRAVIAADGPGITPVVRRRPGKPADLRRAA
jgi:hypothetical protein